MKRTFSLLLVSTLLAAGIGSAAVGASAQLPKGGIINCSSPGDFEDWLDAKRDLANQLRREGVRFTTIHRGVGCLVVTAWEDDGHSHFHYYDPQRLIRVR